MATFKPPFVAGDIIFWRHADVAEGKWVRGKVRSVDLHPADGKFVARVTYRGMVVKAAIPMDDIVTAQGAAATWPAQLDELNNPTANAMAAADAADEPPPDPMAEKVDTLQAQVGVIVAQLATVTQLVEKVTATQQKLMRGQSTAKHCLNQLRFCADPDQLHEFDTMWPLPPPSSSGGSAAGSALGTPRSAGPVNPFHSPRSTGTLTKPPPGTASSHRSNTSSSSSIPSLAASIDELKGLVDIGASSLGTKHIMQLAPNPMVTLVDVAPPQDRLAVFAVPIQQIQADDAQGTWTVRYHSREEMEQLLFARLFPKHDELLDISYGTFGRLNQEWTEKRYGAGVESCHFSYTTQYFPLPPDVVPPALSFDDVADVSEWRVEIVGDGGDMWPKHDTNTLSALMRVIAAPVETAVRVEQQCLAFNRMLKLQDYDRKARGRYALAYGQIEYEQSDEPEFIDEDDPGYDSDSAETIESMQSTASADVRRAAGYSALGLPLHKVSSLIDWTKMEGVELIRLDPRAVNGGRGAGGPCSGKYSDKGWKCVGLKTAFIAEMVKRRGGDYPTVESCKFLNPFTIRDHEMRADRQSSSKLKVRFEELYFPVDTDGNQHTIPWLKWFSWDRLRIRGSHVSEAHSDLFLSLGLCAGDTFRFCAQQGLLYSDNDERAFAKMAFASARDETTNTIKVITYYRFLTDEWEVPRTESVLEERRVKVLDAIKGTVFATIGDGPALKTRKRALESDLGGGSSSDAGSGDSKKSKKSKKKGKGKGKAKARGP